MTALCGKAASCGELDLAGEPPGSRVHRRGLRPTAIADIRIENTSARLIVMLSPAIDLSPSSIVAGDRSKVQCFRTSKPDARGSIK